MEGTNEYKFKTESRLYDYERIESRYRIMQQLRKGKNIKTLAHALRQDLVKNIGGICEPRLYNQCFLGTKRLVEKYHNEVIKSIQTIYYAKPSKMSFENKLQFFTETRHSYGHTALMLSGGATFGKFHFGVLKALHEQDLLPRIICGSSVGSLILGIMACVPIEKLWDGEWVFGRPILGYVYDDSWEMLFNCLSGNTILKTETLKEYARARVGDTTFKENYDKTGWILNITVTEDSFSTSRLFNYLTTPNVLIWSAIIASCAIPGFFEKVDLYIKTDDGRIVLYNPPSQKMKYVDGSVAGDLPMQRMAELFNVNTFIVSQVNPHVVPFVSVDNGSILDTKFTKKFMMVTKKLIGNQIKHNLRQLDTIGLLPSYIKGISEIVFQSYRGHVTIVPSPTLEDYRKVLINVTPEEYGPAVHQTYINTLKSKSIQSNFDVFCRNRAHPFLLRR